MIGHACWRDTVVNGGLMDVLCPEKVGDEYDGYDDYDGNCDEFCEELEDTHEDE